MAPRDPSNCRGWVTFRVGPHFSRPSAQRELLRQRAGCAQRSLPVPCTLQRCPVLRGSDGSRPRRACLARQTGPPLRYYRTQGRMGARVMASGMPGASRCAALGGATYSVVKVWVRLSGAGRPATRQNQRHIPGARPARGCQSWTLCPRVRRPVPSGESGLAGRDSAEARAPG